ncbi:hypothetical protein [Roseicella frigidaeris]|uniref:Uncharacterized protein n=1 Tax=Roseicella frigidaeris TaxID=2230885 RepID=A0A327M8C6_9PROT|nr:hypothetical protein [Roseicella frigidaeris]RAI58572.1 hypothetical protein DOO78_12830 [Roseicella frigidaeris]
MRAVVLSLGAILALGAPSGPGRAQEGVRFDRPVFTTDATALCRRQDQVAALRRALDDNDRAAIDRLVAESCRLVGPNIRLSVVARPGLYDPDVEVQVAGGPAVPASLARGTAWTLKALVRN